METAPQTLIAALRNSHERLASLVHAISDDFLTSRSYCTDWSVAQVLSHLGSGAEISLMMLESTLRGEPMDREAFPAVWDRWNAKTPAQQAADCLPADDAHISRLEGLTQAELDGMSVDFLGMKLDAAGVVRLRLSEHAVHTWDVAAAIDPDAVLAPDAVALLAGQVFWLADLLLDVADKVTLAPWPADGAEQVSVEIQLPAEALIRLFYGRLDPAHTPPVEITGDPALLDLARAVFPGF